MWIAAVMERRIAWSIIACPSEEWAREVFGAPDTEPLWQAVAHALRLDEPDPAAAWAQRLAELQRPRATSSTRAASARCATAAPAPSSRSA